MKPIRVIAILLIVSGVAGLFYGGFTFTKETHQAEIGPLQISVDEKQTVNIPAWLGAGLVLVGTVLLVSKKVGA